jgi:ABC-type enterobactin transport system permease subunit
MLVAAGSPMCLHTLRLGPIAFHALLAAPTLADAGGQRKRVTIGEALLSGARVLALDEVGDKRHSVGCVRTGVLGAVCCT